MWGTVYLWKNCVPKIWKVSAWNLKICESLNFWIYALYFILLNKVKSLFSLGPSFMLCPESEGEQNSKHLVPGKGFWPRFYIMVLGMTGCLIEFFSNIQTNIGHGSPEIKQWDRFFLRWTWSFNRDFLNQ